MVIDWELKEDAYAYETVENARKHQTFMESLNYWIAEGFIEVEEGDDGEFRLYPTT